MAYEKQLMKGHKWSERKRHMTYPAWAEVKHDEIRCHVTVNPQNFAVDYTSYAGKPLHNLQQFDKDWAELARITGIYEFDTGVEANGNYDDSYRWVRSSRGVPADLSGAEVVFYLFDLPSVSGDFQKRSCVRHNVMCVADFDLRIPQGWWVNDADEVDALFIRVRAAGFEGLMVKSTGHEYQRGKRINGWLKVKPEEDADGVIYGFTEAVSESGEPLGRAGSVDVLMEDGSRASPSGIAHDLGRDIFLNFEKYRDQWCEFTYMERDRQGGYRHPVFKRVREAKA